MSKRYFKWIAALVAVVMVFTITAIGCTEPQTETKELVVAGWVGADDPGTYGNVEAAFEELYPDWEVTWKFISDYPELRTKMTADPEFADVLGTDPSEMILFEPFIEPIDVEKITRWEDVDEVVRELYGVTMDSEVYGVPFEMGYSMMIYRGDLLGQWLVDNEYLPGTVNATEYMNQDVIDKINEIGYELLFNPEEYPLDGLILWYDGPRWSFVFPAAAALYELGDNITDMWAMNETQYAAAEAKYMDGKDNVQGYWAGWEEGYSPLISGEAYLVAGWQDIWWWADAELYELSEEPGNYTEGWVYYMEPLEPEHSLFFWLSTWSIAEGVSEDSEVWDAAHDWMDCWLTVEAQMDKITCWAYNPPVPAAADALLADPEYEWYWWLIDEFDLADPAAAMARATVYEPFTEYHFNQWLTIWLSMKE